MAQGESTFGVNSNTTWKPKKFAHSVRTNNL